MGPLSEHEWVTFSWMHQHPTRPLFLHPSTSSSPSGVSQLPCTYTPPSQARELLFISLSTYSLLEWVTRVTVKSVCLCSSCFILPSPLVQFVCLCRLKCWKCWTTVYRHKKICIPKYNLIRKQHREKEWIDGWCMHPQVYLLTNYTQM